MQTTTPQVLHRVKNLVHPSTPWHRALWTVGTHTAIDEIVEYAEVAAQTKGSNEGLRYAARQLIAQVERDHGLGTPEEREAVTGLLEGMAALSAKAYPTEDVLDQTRYWSVRSRSGYLARWFDQIQRYEVHVERTARLVASALLDFGFSERWVLDSSQGRNSESPEEVLGRIIADATGRSSAAPAEFRVAIPLAAVPSPLSRWDGFVDATALNEALNSWGAQLPNDAGLDDRQGGLLTTVRALDPEAAVEAARTVLRSALARMSIARRDKYPPRDLGWAFVEGAPRPIKLHDSRRRISAPSLEFPPQSGWADDMASAIELVSKMEESNPAVVVSSGWAAMEGLLVRGGEPGILAADRMAAIVTCSWPSAELGTLAWQALRDDQDAPTTALKVRKLEAALRSGDSIVLRQPYDQVGLARMTELIADPHPVLERVESYFRDAFRRLYNQRNLAMHRGGRTSPGLAPAVRTLPPLVGAGLDRIAFAQRLGIEPISLAERCKVELSMVGLPGGRSVCDLI